MYGLSSGETTYRIKTGKHNREEIQAEDAIIESKVEKSRAAVKRKVDKNKRLEAAVLIDL